MLSMLKTFTSQFRPEIGRHLIGAAITAVLVGVFVFSPIGVCYAQSDTNADIAPVSTTFTTAKIWGQPMQLSEHFSLAEFEFSETAIRFGFDNEVRVVCEPAEASGIILKLTSLCTTILEPMRAGLGGRGVVITSGWRSWAVNKKLKSGKRSQHRVGEAVDFRVIGVSPADATKWLAESGLPFDDLIFEGAWTHVSHVPQPSARINRGRVRTAVFKKEEDTEYVAGIVVA